ncbi:hypothetical protein GCM10009549_29900 [Streptomyces thermoalcalitolerans]|uniref:Uncharacterized protein n=1 Tax=Streptomyces thermoalcalitolerans TaxID=65605 RepID=A0ABN1NRH5_9ACTN
MTEHCPPSGLPFSRLAPLAGGPVRWLSMAGRNGWPQTCRTVRLLAAPVRGTGRSLPDTVKP